MGGFRVAADQHKTEAVRARCAPGLLATSIVLIALSSPAAAGGYPHELDPQRESATVAAGGLLGVVALGLHEQHDALTPTALASLTPSDVIRIDRSATARWSPGASFASDLLQRILIPMPLTLAITGRGKDEPAVPAVMCAEVVLLTSSIVQLLKGVFPRNRPFVYNPDSRIPLEEKLANGARRSFPSGHAANAFAAAVFMGTVYGDLYPDSNARGWVWGAALTAAACTALLRYVAGRHYPSDLVVGAGVGAAIGYLVPHWHKVDSDEEGRASTVPLLAWRITF
jgi:membrane-associated phospholipid phosphatase